MVLKEKEKYLAICDILLSVTMLSNNFNSELKADSEKIIDFVGGVFKLSKAEMDEIKSLISEELTLISTVKDVKAYFANNGENDYPEISNYLYLKSEALLKLDTIYQKLSNDGFNQLFFDYRYLRPYYPDIRFKELVSSSIKGDININRVIAILLAVGIGCTVDVNAAIYRFKQCAYWGDMSSIYYLSHLCDEKEAKLFKELSSLTSYLSEGRTMIPESKKSEYEPKTIEEFTLISSIRQDIVLAYKQNDIDYSFIEVLLLDKLDYYKKMELINNYREQSWKEYTNSSSDPSKKLGFNLSGGKK